MPAWDELPAQASDDPVYAYDGPAGASPAHLPHGAGESGTRRVHAGPLGPVAVSVPDVVVERPDEPVGGGAGRGRRRDPRTARPDIPTIRMRSPTKGTEVATSRPPQPANGRMLGGAATVLVTTLFMAIVLAIVATQWPRTAPLAVTGSPGATSTAPRTVEPTPQWTQVTPDPEGPPVERTPAPTPTPSGLTGTPWAVPPTGGFSAVAGDGCADTAVAGSFAAFAAGTPITNMPGGWLDANCVGMFWSVPMSGNATRDDPTVYVLWWFNVERYLAGQLRLLGVHPQRTARHRRGGAPHALPGDTWSHRRDGDRQLHHRPTGQPRLVGIWGDLALRDGQIAVKLVNRGAGTGGARHAAAQVKIGCTSIKST